ncbi:12393_t:CDS:2 [Dentiscutata heterogama]|uniref:12393_t:CDS:1 n=1 Tax=Dentiscutata heterogama TaxID=1316150 RepID=A0ACA9K941_9GLOM|nr:12393_t:CDS:2 [Dentiscutata heterogama]
MNISIYLYEESKNSFRMFLESHINLKNIVNDPYLFMSLENGCNQKLGLNVEIGFLKNVLQLAETCCLNAGTALGFDPLEENSQKDIQATIETNVYGLIYMTQAVLPKMKERDSGDIINMGSISGKRSHGFGNAGSKFAIEGITESLRKELLSTKIRVVLVRPGAVKSEFTLVRSYGNAEFSNAYYSGFEPLIPQDVAECVVFVAARPTNVVVSEIEILPNAQADAQSLRIENSDYMKTLAEIYKKK